MGCSPQAPLSVGFPRLDYESKLPFPAPKDLLDRDETCISCLGSWILHHLATREPLQFIWEDKYTDISRTWALNSCFSRGDFEILPGEDEWPHSWVSIGYRQIDSIFHLLLFFNLFIWLQQVLVVACGMKFPVRSRELVALLCPTLCNSHGL